jgi:hypothetical protein
MKFEILEPKVYLTPPFQDLFLTCSKDINYSKHGEDLRPFYQPIRKETQKTQGMKKLTFLNQSFFDSETKNSPKTILITSIHDNKKYGPCIKIQDMECGTNLNTRNFSKDMKPMEINGNS